MSYFIYSFQQANLLFGFLGVTHINFEAVRNIYKLLQLHHLDATIQTI